MSAGNEHAINLSAGTRLQIVASGLDTIFNWQMLSGGKWGTVFSFSAAPSQVLQIGTVIDHILIGSSDEEEVT